MREDSPHNWFSVSKSLTGLTAAILAAEGITLPDIPRMRTYFELVDEPLGEALHNVPVRIRYGSRAIHEDGHIQSCTIAACHGNITR